jgi:hypothetical protein
VRKRKSDQTEIARDWIWRKKGYRERGYSEREVFDLDSPGVD